LFPAIVQPLFSNSNYTKYFDASNLRNRLNRTSDYRFAFAQFNLKFLRLFNSNASHLVLDTRINHLPAILRNLVDMFALSAVRFSLYANVMPQQLASNSRLQFKIVLNQCHLCNQKIDAKLRHSLLVYFYSVFELFKYLCLRAYSRLLGRSRGGGKLAFVKIVNKHLRRMSCENNLKMNGAVYRKQIDDMIEQQALKFFNVEI
jgi:hypothetical protein